MIRSRSSLYLPCGIGSLLHCGFIVARCAASVKARWIVGLPPPSTWRTVVRCTVPSGAMSNWILASSEEAPSAPLSGKKHWLTVAAIISFSLVVTWLPSGALGSDDACCCCGSCFGGFAGWVDCSWIGVLARFFRTSSNSSVCFGFSGLGGSTLATCFGG